MVTQTDEIPREPEFVEQTWDLVYRHSVGETTGRFF
jgi:hypothetical protein